MLSVGIVGLPNVGKSSLFNALTLAGAEVSNYPFTTIDANLGMVVVPDSRLEGLERLLEPEKTTPCTIRFVDIAGLVEGASRGEGLGNQFLGEIRSVDAVAHVVRVFGSGDVVHVAGAVDPVRDASLVETELLLADLEVLERAIGKRRNTWTTDPVGFAPERARLDRYREALAEGTPLRALELEAADRSELKGLGLITGKPVLWVANVDEEADPEAEAARVGAALGRHEPVVAIAARLEAELGELDPDERAEFLRELGIERRGIDRLAEKAFALLDLVRFYTIVKGKLHAWEVPRGTLAPQAAGRVHSDMEEGFVRARVVKAEDLLEHGSMAALHDLGRLKTEGRSYPVEDGDVIEFLFTG